MMKKILIFAFTFIIGLVAVFGLSCGGDNNGSRPRTPTPSNPSTGGSRTPMGINLKLSSPLDASIQNTMDASLAKLFSDVQGRPYSQKIRHSDYTIMIKDDCVDRSGTMSWLDRLDSYDGTEYDQDPRPGIGMIYRAEQVTLNPSRPPEFIICRDSEQNMGNTTRYGAEHIILYYNDRGEYDRTAVHTTGGHPIIPML
jgi:hypothetical protein